MLKAIFAVSFLSLLPISWAKNCTDLLVKVPIVARNGVFGGQSKILDNFDATQLAQNATVAGRNYTDFVLTGYETIQDTFNISAQLCRPTSSVKPKQTIQFLIHGATTDKR
jgi:hypothetical protein